MSAKIDVPAREWLEEQLAAGKAAWQIAPLCRTTERTVQRWMSEYGLHAPQRSPWRVRGSGAQKTAGGEK